MRYFTSPFYKLENTFYRDCKTMITEYQDPTTKDNALKLKGDTNK